MELNDVKAKLEGKAGIRTEYEYLCICEELYVYGYEPYLMELEALAKQFSKISEMGIPLKTAHEDMENKRYVFIVNHP